MNYNNFKRSRSPPPPPQHQQPPPPPLPKSFDFDSSMRPMPNHREFDVPYRHQVNYPYDAPSRSAPGKISQSSMPSLPPSHPNHMAPPMALHHPYADVPAYHHQHHQHHQNYSPHYREQAAQPYGPGQLAPPPQQSSNAYRSAIAHRDPYSNIEPLHGPQHPPFHPAKSSSPPYRILCVTNISNKISDGPLKDALTSDFSRFGDISVSVCHDNGERLAYIYFRNCDEAREARQIKMRTLLFDRPIEIEPIYEPPGRGAADSPGNTSPPASQAAYSPLRRSLSPPGYSRDPSASMPSNRRPSQAQPPVSAHLQHSDMPSPGYPPHRGSTPPEYRPSPGGYHHALSPPPMGPAPVAPGYDRRAAHPGGYPYSPAIPAPYASPPHEPSRQAYPSHLMPYPPSAYERERAREPRAHVSSRSPYRDPYYPPEARCVPAPNHHPGPPPPPSGTVHHAPRRRSRHRGGANRDLMRHRYPAEPPARFMSREYRREKFGADPHLGDPDEGRPSRVLLVINIDTNETDLDLKEVFEPFGTIEEIEVKKVASNCSTALVKFSSMDGAYKAKTANNGRHIGNTRCRIVYGKVSSSRRLWIGGLSPSMTKPMMEEECGKYGDIASMDYTSGRPYCYVEYDSANQAQFAAYHLRTTLTPASERKIRIEFVDPDRSEKLLPRHMPNSHSLSDINSKSRAITESNCDITASPHSSGGLSGRKRSVSPASDLSISKRICPPMELPLAANTFKQERLVAAAAAKARTSSTGPQLADRSTTKLGDSQDSDELNNNSDSKQSLGDGIPAMRERALGSDSMSQEAPGLEILTHCTNIRQVVNCCRVSWSSQIALRNFIFPAQIYMCSGRKQLIDRYLSRPCGDNGHSVGPILRITQRWRLHPQPKLEEVKRRMQTGNLGILILTARQETSPASRHTAGATLSHDTNRHQVAPAVGDGLASSETSENAPTVQQNGNADDQTKANDETPTSPVDRVTEEAAKLVNSLATSGEGAGPSTPNHVGTPPTPGSSSQSRPLRNLISYLEQKDAAGVISLSAAVESNGELAPSSGSGGGGSGGPDGSASSSKLLYAFPPGDFAWNILKRKAPNLLPDASRDEFLLGVIVGGNVEGGKI